MPGEIVGIAGVEGNGQRVLADVLSSLTALNSGSVKVQGREIATGRPGAMSKSGIGVIPEDRHDSGCVLDMSVAENLVLADQESVAQRGFLDRKKITALAEDLVKQFGVSCSSVDAPMWTLSGGNQQRVVLARELSTGPSVLVAAQPTRGLDVGAIEYMGERLKQAAAEGVGVLLISSEIEELIELSDRILVMYRGAIVGEMKAGEIDMHRLGMMMGGAV
jgi:general nucleoside transport system ATP-binding protein